MDTEASVAANKPVAKWAFRFGAVGLFGGFLIGLSKGGGLAFAVGMALPVGLVAAAGGAVVGIVLKVLAK